MDTDSAKKTLEVLAESLSARLERIDAHHHRTPDADSAERAVELENEDVVNSLEAGGLAELGQVRNALARIAAGTYQTCSVCCGEIDPRRLEAVPYTDRCIACADQDT